MLIKRIWLNRFKKFESLELSLLPGLNIIKGPNEAGKSTLHSAVIAGLFFNPSHRRAEIKNNISWNSDKMYKIGLKVEEDKKEYVLNKDFETKKIQMTGVDLEHEIVDPSNIGQRLHDWLGYSSAAVFRSTACIEQDKISKVTKGEKEIGDILQSTITGEDDTIANDAIIILNNALDGASKGNPANCMNNIEKISKQIEELEKEHRRVSAEINSATKSNVRLLEIEEALAGINSVLKTKVNLRAKNERRRELRTELNISEEKLQHVKNVLKLDEEIKMLDERLSVYEPLFDLADEDIEQFHSLLGKKQSLEELQKSLEAQLERPKQKVVQRKPKLNEFFIAGLVLLWVGLIGAILTKYLLVLAFLGLISLCAGLFLMISRSEVQIELSPGQIRNQINRSSEQLNLVDESIKYFLSRTKCASAHEFTTKLEGYKPLNKRKVEKEAELSGMIGKETIEQIKQASNELNARIDKIKEELRTLDAFALDPEAYQRLIDELDRLNQEKSELENEERELVIITSGAKPTNQDLAIIKERLASLQQKLELYRQRIKTYNKCLECLQTAREKTLRSATYVLEQEIEKHISTITDSRYAKVKVDADTLNVSVYSSEKHDFVDVQKLSGATIDQIYLAARLGLVKLVSGSKKPPLLLDDPFVTFDDNRLETTMEMLRQIGKEYQVLLFTCSNRYDQYADKVVDLRTYSVLSSGVLTNRDHEAEVDPAFLSETPIFTEPPQSLEQ